MDTTFLVSLLDHAWALLLLIFMNVYKKIGRLEEEVARHNVTLIAEYVRKVDLKETLSEFKQAHKESMQDLKDTVNEIVKDIDSKNEKITDELKLIKNELILVLKNH